MQAFSSPYCFKDQEFLSDQEEQLSVAERGSPWNRQYKSVKPGLE